MNDVVRPSDDATMRVVLLVVLVLGGCARGSVAGSDDGSGGGGAPKLDAGGIADARPGTPPDDAMPTAIDAMPDAPPPPPPDPCIPMTTQLLANPSLDAAPQGTGWAQQIIKAGYPLITSMDNASGPTEHTAPYKAWLGGFTGQGVTDVLSQDVAIPPATSALVLTGFHAVRTDDASGAVYDTAVVALTQTTGAPIATVLSVSNQTSQGPWAPFSHTFAQGLSGQTVRLRISSTNDAAYPTSFYFDSLALTATHGCL